MTMPGDGTAPFCRDLAVGFCSTLFVASLPRISPVRSARALFRTPWKQKLHPVRLLLWTVASPAKGAGRSATCCWPLLLAHGTAETRCSDRGRRPGRCGYATGTAGPAWRLLLLYRGGQPCKKL